MIPNGKHDRRHRGTTLLLLLVAGTGGVGVMVVRGHVGWLSLDRLFYADRVPSRIAFVPVKIA